MFCPILTKFGLSHRTYRVPSIKLHEIPSNGRDMEKLIYVFRYLRERAQGLCTLPTNCVHLCASYDYQNYITQIY